MRTLDERGKACPLPVVEAKQAMEQEQAEEELCVIVDNEIAVQNLKKMAAHRGYGFSAEKKEERKYHVFLRRPEASAKNGGQEAEQENGTGSEPDSIVPAGTAPAKGPAPRDRRGGGIVAVISSGCMGTGDDRLGSMLMKSFLFALARQEPLPDTVLLYNGGAFLSCEGSESLEDLKLLEQAGTEILTCGTCLDFYGLKDRLAVGQVTNMYEIVEKQMQAGLVVRP
jgi:selenium metabolism protein YedF